MTLSLSVGRISCYFNPATGLFEAQIGSNGAAGSQLYAYQPSTLSVIPLTTDAAGNLNVVGVGGGGGGTVTQGPAAALAGAWPVELTDGTNGPAAVKAASTAAVAADKALVVAVSPNNAVAVTGTFWQATQPVSGTVTTTPPTDATTNLTKVGGTAITLGAKTSAASIPVVLASDEAALPVTGTFWQATQPISGTVTTTPPANASTNIAQVGAAAVSLGAKTSALSIPVVLASDEAALPVTGTFWQATQPVSGTVTANQGTANTAANAWPAKITDGTSTAAVKAASTAAVATDQAVVVAVSPNNSVAVTQATAANLNATVTPIALTKGTQGATGFSVQNLRDAGRNVRIFMLDAFTAAPVVEAVQTVVQWYGNAAVVGTTQPAVVPAGKTLRLTGWKIMYQSLATVGAAVVRVRCNTAGLGVLASPLVFSFEAGTNSGATTTAVTGAMTTQTGEFPEGIDIPAAAGLAFSMAGYGPTGTLTLEGTTRFMVYGYEF